jgi:twinkle protein
MGNVVEKTACPSCVKQGRDNSGDNLARYEDGGAKCYACGYTEPRGGATKQVKERSKLAASQCMTYPVGHDPARKISEATIKLYDIRSSYNEETGLPEKTFYPYFDDISSTEPSEFKVRNNSDKRKMLCTGKLPGFFGKNTCTPSQGRLLITEGEEDALAAKEMLPVKIDVVSLPNGGSVDNVVKNDLEFLERYKDIYICLDADTIGIKASTELADWLSGSQAKLKVVGLDPDIGKDASDYWVAGEAKAFRDCIKNARVYEPDGVVNGVDINLDDLLEKMPEGYPTPFQGINDKLHGLRKGEIVTVCAGSGIGKSTLVREMLKSLIEQGLTVANVALEDQMNVAAQALIALDMNIPLPQFRVNPPPKADVQPHYDKVVGNGHTYFYKHFGGLSVETLMPKLYYYARSKECDFIGLDHLSMVISGSESRNERKDIDTLMHKLAQMVVETGVGLIQIVHLKRTGGDKSFAKGGEVELTDLRGSAALEQLSWAVIGMERDQQSEDSDFSNVRILKNRTWGFTGLCDTLKYDTQTGRLQTGAPSVPDLEGEEDELS